MSDGNDDGSEIDYAQEWLFSNWSSSPLCCSELLGIVTLPAGKFESLVPSLHSPVGKLFTKALFLNMSQPASWSKKNMETCI